LDEQNTLPTASPSGLPNNKDIRNTHKI